MTCSDTESEETIDEHPLHQLFWFYVLTLPLLPIVVGALLDEDMLGFIVFMISIFGPIMGVWYALVRRGRRSAVFRRRLCVGAFGVGCYIAIWTLLLY